MSIAIKTRFIGASNFRPARIVAETMSEMPPARLGGEYKPVRIYKSYQYSGNETEHFGAAKELCVKLGWPGVYVSAGTETGYVYVRLAMNATGTLPALEAVDVAFIVTAEEAAPAIKGRQSYTEALRLGMKDAAGL